MVLILAFLSIFQDYLHWWVLILQETYDHWSVAVLTVTVDSSFFPTFNFFLNMLLSALDSISTPLFMFPYIIMDLPIFVIAEWATLLVDIRCHRGGPQVSIRIHFSGLAPLMSADIARNLWSLVCSCLNSYCTFFIFSHFWFFFKYVAFCTGFNLLTPLFMLPYIIMDLPIFVIAEWATLLVDIRCPRGGS